MKQAVLTSLEPLLLLRARHLASELPVERRARVVELSNAADRRARLARELREPELTPVALLLLREALALSVSALLAFRGALGGVALSARDGALQVPELTPSDGLRAFFESVDPAFADQLEAPVREALALELESALERVRSLYEPRPARRLALISMLRVGLSIAAVVIATLAFIAVTARPT